MSVDNKIPLDLPETASLKEARELSWSMGLHVYGCCDVCHRWIINETHNRICEACKHA